MLVLELWACADGTAETSRAITSAAAASAVAGRNTSDMAIADILSPGAPDNASEIDTAA